MKIIVGDRKDYKGKWFRYEGVEFQVAYIDDHEQTDITEQAIDPDSEEKLDALKMRYLIVKKGLQNWRGMTIGKLKEFCEPEPLTKIELDEGETWDDEVPFNEENKMLLLRHMHYKFAHFVSGKTRAVKAHHESQVEKEHENLGPGSGGKKRV